MKKTIAATALIFSASSSFAIVAPGHDQYVTKTYCLSTWTYEDGSAVTGSCDETANNTLLGLTKMQNGCAENQSALTTSKRMRDAEFPVKIRACRNPNIVQL